MKKKLFMLAALFTSLLGQNLSAANSYGIPDKIQDGNILHCFDWTMAEVKAELANIAAAGFGSVQLSPLQRSDVRTGTEWHALYRPYDLAFKASGMGSADDLKSLCAEAEKYGIKVIVDVVANHVDKTSGYHDTWWDSNGRIRWNGGINYGDRYSITHGQLGDYGDINSESQEVIARAKAYVESLKSMGVKGIRWDAAKHIGLPSEGCNFWSTMASVSGMYHYGEILDSPGPNESIIKEYAQYMSVTDNRYSNGAAKDNGGIPYGHGGAWDANYGLGDKVVYWGESHDTYSNDEWSQNVDQSVIDRAYASFACRKGATALYFARPNVKGFNNIKVGKGSTAFKNKHIAEVNKFRNAMIGKADYFTNSGNAISVTRQNGGAVIVMKGSGNVSIANGGGYCPAGTYTDRVSGNTFTVTASTISGNVGSSGIAVLYNGGSTPTPDPDDPDPVDPTTGSLYILGNLEGTAGWSTTPGTGAAMTQNGSKYTAKSVKFVAAAGESKCYFNLTDYVGATWDDLNMMANRYGAATEGEAITLGTPATIVKYANNVDASGCLSWTVPAGTYDITADLSTMKITVVNAGQGGDDPDPVDPTPDPTDEHYIYFDGTSFSQPQVWAWNDGGNCTTATAWPGDNMTKNGSNWYWAVPAGKSLPTGLIIHEGDTKIGGGDLKYVDHATYHQDGTYTQGGTPGPGPDPTTDVTIYFDNTNSNWATPHIHYWGGTESTWPGVAMAKVDGNIWKYVCPAGTTGILFNAGDGDATKTSDFVAVNNHVYNTSGDQGEYQGGDDPTPGKPVVTATPGTSVFVDNVTVTLTVSPATDIYYTTNGTTPSASSTKYTAPLTFTETTTLKTYVKNEGGENVQTFTYTKRSQGGDDPTPSGNNLITDYYKVNPNGQVGTNKTINMSFNGQKSSTALSNWTPAELIAQGVARDVAQAYKGNHERPVVDSYAIYAAYDNDNLYLGVQFVYTVWDLYGEGKQPGESKPYNMDGHMCIAFDLDPNKSFDGYINGTGPIWNDTQKGAKFNNGVDAVWMGSTKPGVGTPGFFIPTADGHASYDAAYCKSIPGSYYGYADGLLPSIDKVWGQAEFNGDPEALKSNTGFVDLRSEITDDAHTFYEWKFPLSVLGVTADYIRNNGIGVMYLDKYGSSPVGGTPYDPSYFDNVKGSYSQDPSSSQEKEDEDVITYSPARIGNLGSVSGIASATENVSNLRVYAAEGKLYVIAPEATTVNITTMSGMTIVREVNAGVNVIDDLDRGFYIVDRVKVVL